MSEITFKDEFEGRRVLSKKTHLKIEDENIDAIYSIAGGPTNEKVAGDIIVLSHKPERGYERCVHVPSGAVREKSYDMIRFRDFTPLFITLGSPIAAVIIENPLALIPCASSLYLLRTCKKTKNTSKHEKRVEEFRRTHYSNAIHTIENETKGIDIYQISMKELSQLTGKNLELVETGKQKKFIEAEDDFWLLAKASGLGADAVVEYQAGSPARGTPVKFVDKK